MPTKKASSKQPSWMSIIVALLVLVATGSLVVSAIPALPNNSNGFLADLKILNYHELVAIVATTCLTLIFLAYFRAKLFFSNRWLIAAVTYSSLILFVKFSLSTEEFINQSSIGFSSVFSTAALVSLLYLFAFGVLYLFFNGNILNKKLHKALITSTEGKILLAMGLFICASLVRIIAFRLPLLSSTTASSYLDEVFKSNSVLLSAVLFVMVLGAVEAYAQVRRKEDLKYFFIVGASLILTFHLWWALFVYRSYQ
jgi:hypothetical protein